MSSINAAQHAVDEKLSPATAANASSSVDMPAKQIEGIRDVAADLFMEIRQYSPEELQSERALVRKKLDWVIMPMFVPLLCIPPGVAYTFTADARMQYLRYILPPVPG